MDHSLARDPSFFFIPSSVPRLEVKEEAGGMCLKVKEEAGGMLHPPHNPPSPPPSLSLPPSVPSLKVAL